MSALAIHPYVTCATPSADTQTLTEEPPVSGMDLHATDDEIAARALASARLRWTLSARECQVLAHLSEGDANKEIASKLGCALRTVEAHVTSILNKSRCASRAQVVAHFWRGQ